MIKFENTEVSGIVRAVYSARNAMNSWDKSDSDWNTDTLGEADLSLAKRLIKAGSDHRKFMRMVVVWVDITAPMYWVAEHDTYKIGTVRNSCSFMHRGLSKPFTINDFSISDERVYELLNPIVNETYELTYTNDTADYRIYTTENGREYKVFSNGKVYRCEFSLTDKTGRTRTFAEKEVMPSVTNGGYYEINIGGRSGEKWLLHRLIATVWIDNPQCFDTVNHIDGNKGNNDISNLEWASREDNIRLAFECGLYSKHSLSKSYVAWKHGHINVAPTTKLKIKSEHKNGLSPLKLAEKYNVSRVTIYNILNGTDCENADLFYTAYMYETLIDTLNRLREEYIETKNEEVFFTIRQLLPQGYNIKYTWAANYEVLRNMYHQRRHHKLTEWHDFCEWIEALPYAKELIIGNE